MSQLTEAFDELTEPAVRIEADHFERLQDLALAAMAKTPDVAAALLREVERAVVVPKDALPGSVVTIGSRLVFRDEASGREQAVTLVFPGEADISRQRISVLTPVGVALIGLEEGASKTFRTRANQSRQIRVIEVKPPEEPDASVQPLEG